ncbi:MAG: LysR substrate-binding domain-containing protein, partial [Pseudomonadota bacterium]
PDFFVRDQLASGRLVELLRGQVDSSAGLFSVYPKSHHVSPKVRVFLDFLIDYLSNVQRDQKTLDGDEFRQ